jgi:hypothetical protein
MSSILKVPRSAHTKVAVGYNAQVAVDAKNKMIVDQDVTNQIVDMGLLTQAAEPARAILDVENIDVVADRGTRPGTNGAAACRSPKSQPASTC